MTDKDILVEILDKVSRVDERTKGLPDLEKRVRTVETRQSWLMGASAIIGGAAAWVGQHVGFKDIS